jgi:hypothetical protein
MRFDTHFDIHGLFRRENIEGSALGGAPPPIHLAKFLAITLLIC